MIAAGPGRRWLAVTAVAVVATGGVLAWQVLDDRDPYADYCDVLEQHQQGIGEELAAGGETTGLIGALPAFRQLQREAPEDIADEWAVVVGRLDALEAAVEAAGVEPADYDRSAASTVDAREQARIDAAAAALAAPESREAFAGVAQHARDVCHTPLHL